MKKAFMILLAALLAISVGACGTAGNTPEQSPAGSAADVPAAQAIDNTYTKREGVDVIYLAGGCFWGTEALMQTIPGVVNATSGYANGKAGVEADYDNAGANGFRETVRVEYEPELVSLDTILFTYFRSIDPTVTDRQGNDIGGQYQSGIYWADDAAEETVMRIADVEKMRYPNFAVELEQMESFWKAEDYHQDYLNKNPGGYCHITMTEFRNAANIIVDPADYIRPTDAEIEASLNSLQYRVTQEAGTEMAFENPYWDAHDKGIYVDIVTGEPLFSSSDKFDSGTGWPSFTKAIDDNTMVYLADASGGMARTEVRSRAGNSHLGHVFYGENESPSGERFCINSAALRFIDYDDMEAEGYGYLTDYMEQ